MESTKTSTKIWLCYDCGNESRSQLDSNEHYQSCELRIKNRAEFVQRRMERFGYVMHPGEALQS